jgi:O-antigen/teichoic acid export membrane protein
MILIPKIGISGAAISTSIAYSTFIFFYCKYFKELTTLPFREFLLPQWKDLIYFKTQAGRWIK